MDLCSQYRPNTFNSVLGQEGVVKSLKDLIEKEHRLPNATLLSGPSGVGKTTIARVCGYTIGCTNDVDHIIEVNGASTNGIDDMRALVESISYRTLDGKPRIVIIDEAHRITKAAFDSVLKPIENPPIDTYWIFCSTEPSKFPAAISTRCTHYALQKVSGSIIFNLLQEVATKEKIEQEKKVLVYLATKADGSPRRALKFLEMVKDNKSFEDIKVLLQSADVEGDKAAIDLARALIAKADYMSVALPILKRITQDAETVRIIVMAYFTTVALNAKDIATAESAIRVMYKFSTPCNPSDKMAPIIIATASCLME